MHFFNKKGTEKVFNTIIEMVLLLIFLAIVVFVIANVFSAPSITRSSGAIACYVTNGLSSSPVLGWVMPTTCSIKEEGQPIARQRLAELLVGSWFMYGRGKWDIRHSDKGYAVYSFKLSGEFGLSELLQYLLQNSEGKPASLQDSDYTYLQKGSEGQTLCIDESIKSTMASTFKPDVQYYIIFYDDAGLADCGDKLVISLYPNEVQGMPYYCVSPERRETQVVTDSGCTLQSWGGA